MATLVLLAYDRLRRFRTAAAALATTPAGAAGLYTDFVVALAIIPIAGGAPDRNHRGPHARARPTASC
jgi:hypothetical protein